MEVGVLLQEITFLKSAATLLNGKPAEEIIQTFKRNAIHPLSYFMSEFLDLNPTQVVDS